MKTIFHNTITWCFYILGISFFIAWLLYRNQIQGAWAIWWLSVADLPLLISAVLYGGSSLYRSVCGTGGSKALLITIAVPVAVIIGLFVAMNFWPSA